MNPKLTTPAGRNSSPSVDGSSPISTSLLLTGPCPSAAAAAGGALRPRPAPSGGGAAFPWRCSGSRSPFSGSSSESGGKQRGGPGRRGAKDVKDRCCGSEESLIVIRRRRCKTGSSPRTHHKVVNDRLSRHGRLPVAPLRDLPLHPVFDGLALCALVNGRRRHVIRNGRKSTTRGRPIDAPYVWPSPATTGSLITVWVMGHAKPSSVWSSGCRWGGDGGSACGGGGGAGAAAAGDVGTPAVALEAGGGERSEAAAAG